MKVRLKAINLNADFRCSERTNYDLMVKKGRFPGPPKKGEVYLLVSRSGNQMVWVLNVSDQKDDRGRTRPMIDTRRWRLSSGTWSPSMLQNYANAVGLTLVGFSRLEAEYKLKRAG